MGGRDSRHRALCGTEWCHPQNHPRAFGDGADGARPQGTLTPSAGCVWSQHRCPRPCALSGPQVLMPARTQPSSGGQCCGCCKSSAPQQRVNSPKSGPRLSTAPAASLPNPWAGRRQTPTSGCPSESLFLQPQSSWRARRGCQFLSGGLCPLWSSAPHNPLSPHRPHSLHSFTKHIG